MAACCALETTLEYEKRIRKKTSQASIHHGSVMKVIVQKPSLSFSHEKGATLRLAWAELLEFFEVVAKKRLVKRDLSLEESSFLFFVNGTLSQTPFSRRLSNERAPSHQR